MKTKSFLLGVTFFLIGAAVTFGIGVNARHHNYRHEAGIRKAAVIEVGAPLKMAELQKLGLI